MEKKFNLQNAGGIILLKCKDFRILQLEIGSTDDLVNLVSSIEKLASLGNYL